MMLLPLIKVRIAGTNSIVQLTTLMSFKSKAEVVGINRYMTLKHPFSYSIVYSAQDIKIGPRLIILLKAQCY